MSTLDDIDFKPNNTMKPLPEHVKEALEKGPMDSGRMTPLQDADDLLQPGYLPVETGYTRMDDGQIAVACLTKMPGVKGKMITWWFEWFSTSEHYRWWHPHAHKWSDNSPRISTSPYGRFVDSTHFVHEQIGPELLKLRINFVDPSTYFDVSKFTEENISAILCGRTGFLDKPLDMTNMFHMVRDTEDGCEMRSRFYVGDIRVRIPLIGPLLDRVVNAGAMRCIIIKDSVGRSLLSHCAEEYQHMAGFLPDLYARHNAD